MTDTPKGNEGADIAALAASLEMLGIRELSKAEFAALMGKIGHMPIYMPTRKEFEAFFRETLSAYCIDLKVVNLKEPTDAELLRYLQLVMDRMGSTIHDLAVICTKEIAKDRKASEEAHNIAKRLLSARDEHKARMDLWRGPSKNPTHQKKLKR